MTLSHFELRDACVARHCFFFKQKLHGEGVKDCFDVFYGWITGASLEKVPCCEEFYKNRAEMKILISLVMRVFRFVTFGEFQEQLIFLSLNFRRVFCSCPRSRIHNRMFEWLHRLHEQRISQFLDSASMLWRVDGPRVCPARSGPSKSKFLLHSHQHFSFSSAKWTGFSDTGRNAIDSFSVMAAFDLRLCDARLLYFSIKKRDIVTGQIMLTAVLKTNFNVTIKYLGSLKTPKPIIPDPADYTEDASCPDGVSKNEADCFGFNSCVGNLKWEMKCPANLSKLPTELFYEI